MIEVDFENPFDEIRAKLRRRGKEFRLPRVFLEEILSLHEATVRRLQDLLDVEQKVREMTYTPEDGAKLALDPSILGLILVSSLERWLGDKSEAPNYRAATLSIKPAGQVEEYLITVTRPHGKTPEVMHCELKQGVLEFISKELFHTFADCEVELYTKELLERLKAIVK